MVTGGPERTERGRKRRVERVSHARRPRSPGRPHATRPAPPRRAAGRQSAAGVRVNRVPGQALCVSGCL